MPNWVDNRLTVHGPARDVTEFLERVKGTEEVLDFGTLFPKVLEDWEDDRLAVEVSVEVFPGEENAQAVFEFSSAWSAPTEYVTEASLLFPTLTFHLKYFGSEDAFVGFLVCQGGTVKEEECISFYD
jgi:hypothetical protein